ncbi:MAG TPA: TlpA disulfide reductase family protein, partial [Cyclobacteriaceae bacterium]|nr:TlpA disulfide reductase family protein [Cyclobacteriaceae bacterium]
TSCETPIQKLKTGTWRGVLHMQDRELPFTFRVTNDTVYLQNAGEEILLDEIKYTGDTVEMMLHIFDASLKARIDGDKLSGTFVKYYAPQTNIPFTATFGDNYRFTKEAGTPSVDYTGTYQILFKTEKESYPSVGVFKQDGSHVTGSFLTPTGDYRFLEGSVIDNKLNLSTFDGNHAYLFVAAFEGDSLKGDYYAGKSSHETWGGVKNPNAAMPDAEALTFLKPGFEKLEFSFPDLNGNKVSLSDEKFKDKVVILQIFGTWCPNCMDETKYLAPWYRANKDRGVEILGLAYERKDDFNYAKQRIEKMKSKMDVPYDFVFAGTNDKEKAAETLPALNKVVAFPTTIFVGKDGKVKHIHTGFEGPGTGIYYERFQERFNQIVNELLAEK